MRACKDLARPHLSKAQQHKVKIPLRQVECSACTGVRSRGLGICFTVLSFPGSQRQLKPWSLEAWPLNEMVVDLGTIQLLLVLQERRILDIGGHEGSHWDFKESLGDRQSITGLESWKAFLKWAMPVDVRRKLQLLWRAPWFRAASNMENLLRKAKGIKPHKTKEKGHMTPT